jgi:hypothetical protein
MEPNKYTQSLKYIKYFKYIRGKTEGKKVQMSLCSI